MPTHRETAIINSAKDTIDDPAFKVLLPRVFTTTLDQLFSEFVEVREGFKFLGRTALHFAFALACIEVCGGLGAGMPVGMLGMLENCLLSEEILFEIMKKPCHRKVRHRITSQGVDVVRDFVYLYVGGLWYDTQDLGKVIPWIRNTFTPLIRAAIDAYKSYRPPKKACKIPQGQSKPRESVELIALHRLLAILLAQGPLRGPKPLKPKYIAEPKLLTPSPSPSPPASPPTEHPSHDAIEVHGPDDNSRSDSEEDAAVLHEPRNTSSMATSLDDSSSSDAVRSPQDEQIQTSSLKPPHSLKRKAPSGVEALEDPRPPHSKFLRTPLASLHLPNGARSNGTVSDGRPSATEQGSNTSFCPAFVSYGALPSDSLDTGRWTFQAMDVMEPQDLTLDELLDGIR